MNPDPDHPQLPTIKIHHPPSPHHNHHHSSSTPSSAAATPTPTAGARRKIGVAVDLSEESAYAVRWAVDHYIRPGDAVVLLHVSPTSVLFGADWGPLPLKTQQDPSDQQQQQQQPSQEDFDAFTASKVADLAKPLKESGFPYKIHIVKDHDMRERLCLEIERLGLSAVIMGRRKGVMGSLGLLVITVFITVFVLLLSLDTLMIVMGLSLLLRPVWMMMMLVLLFIMNTISKMSNSCWGLIRFNTLYIIIQVHKASRSLSGMVEECLCVLSLAISGLCWSLLSSPSNVFLIKHGVCMITKTYFIFLGKKKIMNLQ